MNLGDYSGYTEKFKTDHLNILIIGSLASVFYDMTEWIKSLST